MGIEKLKIRCGNLKTCKVRPFLKFDKESYSFVCPVCCYEVSARDKARLRELNSKGGTVQGSLIDHLHTTHRENRSLKILNKRKYTEKDVKWLEEESKKFQEANND